MLFTSISFGVFFVLVFLLYWGLPGRMRPILLLAASGYFYMAFVPYYILILAYLIVVDYFLGRAIENSVGKKRHLYFLLSIFSTVGTLVIFKYFNFFSANIADLASFLHWNYSLEVLSLALPIGLSFHTFQSLAYVIEVYRGKYQAEKNFLIYALYVMFFPQLVAGPIERPAHLLPQLKVYQKFNYDGVVSGLQQMLWGFFKKLVIGDQLAKLVDFVYTNVNTSDASVLIAATIAFSFVLYADFSGYTDIALGSARMLGIELVPNFQQPYFSASIAEFWRRWHISLSSWFRDYFYYPLAYRQLLVGRAWLYISLVITFLIVGLWHGAGWTFVIMGGLFGSYIVLGLVTKKTRDAFVRLIRIDRLPRLHRAAQIMFTFALVSLTWIFFRAQSVQQAFEMLRRILTEWSGHAFNFLRCSDCAILSIGISRTELAFAGLSILLMLYVEWLQYSNASAPSFWKHRIVRWGAYYAFLSWILFTGQFDPRTFIYFQF